MIRRFTEHPASVNETYFQHMGMAFGFGSMVSHRVVRPAKDDATVVAAGD